MSQYGVCCNPAANFPDPNRRAGSGGQPFNNSHNRQHGRSRFYSPRLHRASEILQNPMSISLREMATVLFAVFVLYHAYLAAGHMYDILALRDVGRVCSGSSAMQCLRFHAWLCLLVMFDWASTVLPWAFVGVVAVFFAEELLRAASQRLQK